MQLRGFDTYEITLGDEMRGERASLGKSLAAAEKDLRIKGALIEAIENCDLSAFPNHSVVAGYVRCYARYLKMDPDACYTRFCAESGFKSPVAMMASTGRSSGASLATDPLNSSAGSQISASRFAAPPIPHGLAMRVSVGGLVSSAVLLSILAGLSYGGFALLKDIQRVGFAPLVEAPEIVAEAPAIAAPDGDLHFTRPAAADYAGDGALAGIEIPADLPEMPYPRRDGPISAIDPATYGIFARPEQTIAMREGVASGLVDSADDVISLEQLQASAVGVRPAVEIDPRQHALPSVSSISSHGITVHAVESSWIRIRENGDTVLFEGILDPGQRFSLPAVAADPVLRTGNAGGIYVAASGELYGPVGRRGSVVKNLSLVPEEIRARFPRAESDAIQISAEPLPSGSGPIEQRAAVDLD
ncbi:MAG: RodZ domain-containing protein [Pseudomonadota bacterium]